jgi:hypothetical protein
MLRAGLPTGAGERAMFYIIVVVVVVLVIAGFFGLR